MCVCVNLLLWSRIYFEQLDHNVVCSVSGGIPFPWQLDEHNEKFPRHIALHDEEDSTLNVAKVPVCVYEREREREREREIVDLTKRFFHSSDITTHSNVIIVVFSQLISLLE